ncbi:AraC family transcriptional regulator [Kaistia dalseonensis]|uniref:AraC-like DNA-binding protein n=1 Tax=Kaistia dalseonensis TaxID=410840 RepID=A0ABU0H7R2_9HYPH|nr:AraC family transcriptional regulator [Kaistia dalseonensis]MCX5495753.1 AraC family transcriptional regulator [Kaistia dalseonensis]MDQ0438353.1 AraC-like DNA-binding protein [Kaistia dalseonensis]
MSTLEELRRLALQHSTKQKTVTPIARFEFLRQAMATELVPVLYVPVLCLVLQGAKRVLIGDTVLKYKEGEYFVAAIEVPALGQIAEASSDRPYLAINFYLDPAIIASVLLETPSVAEASVACGFAVNSADPHLLDAWRRMSDLLNRPEEISVLAPLIEREIIFRLLNGPQGALLQQIANSNSRLSRIRTSMAWIREKYNSSIGVEDLARVAGMSVSVFHKHFKAVTTLSPIQYQKQIRLHEARRRMLVLQDDIASAAFFVGYESVSQFSREYRRLFGASPAKDSKRLRSISSPDVLASGD